MVEAAWVMPVFMLFLFGIIEFPGYLLAKEGTTDAVQAGARMASVQGNDAMADQQILLRMADEAGSIPDGEIEQIVVWRACRPRRRATGRGCTAVGANRDGEDPRRRRCGSGLQRLQRPQASGGAFERRAERHPDLYFGCAVPATGSSSDCGWGADHAERAAEARHREPVHAAVNARLRAGIYVKAVYRSCRGSSGRRSPSPTPPSARSSRTPPRRATLGHLRTRNDASSIAVPPGTTTRGHVDRVPVRRPFLMVSGVRHRRELVWPRGP